VPRRVIWILLAINAVLIVRDGSSSPAGSAPGAGGGSASCFDLGGKNDKSFNTAAWRGSSGRMPSSVSRSSTSSRRGNDRESALRSLAAKHVDP